MQTVDTRTAEAGEPQPEQEAAPPRTRSAAFRLPARADRVAEARRLLRQQLECWFAECVACDDAVLILSELFTNAVVHTESREIACQINASGTLLYLATVDEGAGSVHTRPHEPDSEGGRGLFIVSTLAERWGVAGRPGTGRTVWATLRLGGDLSA
jgi:anti-sigma regulatory factor (Ser/Thr protein kinase)